LNGSAATNAFLQSPYLTNGVGAISFWYRNGDGSGKTNGVLAVQVATSTTSSAWTTLTNIANIISTNYVCATVPLSDPNSHCVRILNDTNANHALLCLDEVSVADPGAGVNFSGLTNSPVIPTWTDAVQVTVNISPARGRRVFKHSVLQWDQRLDQRPGHDQFRLDVLWHDPRRRWADEPCRNGIILCVLRLSGTRQAN